MIAAEPARADVARVPGEYDELERPSGLSFGPGNGRSRRQGRETDPLYRFRVRARYRATAWFPGLGCAVVVGPSRRRHRDAENDAAAVRGYLKARFGVEDVWPAVDRTAPRRAADQEGM